MPHPNEWPHADVTPIEPLTVRSIPRCPRKVRVRAPNEPQQPSMLLVVDCLIRLDHRKKELHYNRQKGAEKGGQNNHRSQLVIRSRRNHINHHSQCSYDDQLERGMHPRQPQGKNCLKQGQELRVGPSRCNSLGAHQGNL
ncbi:hypothetical protein CJ030_MR5G025109 [Morella rubra]|uniref:Uncharacterized protein n=1 Tax=Morella rubra TaxID=262757 RepID=A0A6A1VHV0_9ROSI|nr:hypothetical protein CJ030_MR5G025109 [Morella rubra]